MGEDIHTGKVMYPNSTGTESSCTCDPSESVRSEVSYVRVKKDSQERNTIGKTCGSLLYTRTQSWDILPSPSTALSSVISSSLVAYIIHMLVILKLFFLAYTHFLNLELKIKWPTHVLFVYLIRTSEGNISNRTPALSLNCLLLYSSLSHQWQLFSFPLN